MGFLFVSSGVSLWESRSPQPCTAPRLGLAMKPGLVFVYVLPLSLRSRISSRRSKNVLILFLSLVIAIVQTAF